ncbi:hypothetical protein STFE110948_02590 [Streptobacillus felis]|uniref:hypothetical protein n=1 Tax=Streptobacillus felis TaxID=1384509 RepID=UPI00083402BA|nr:hypothetical protein [Streptobacillus felis]
MDNLDTLKQKVIEWLEQEYEESYTLEYINEEIDKNNGLIGIAYTIDSFDLDEEFEIEVKLDINNLSLITYIDGEVLETIEYENIQNLIDELKYSTFEDIVRIDPESYFNLRMGINNNHNDLIFLDENGQIKNQNFDEKNKVTIQNLIDEYVNNDWNNKENKNKEIERER